MNSLWKSLHWYQKIYTQVSQTKAKSQKFREMLFQLQCTSFHDGLQNDRADFSIWWANCNQTASQCTNPNNLNVFRLTLQLFINKNH